MLEALVIAIFATAIITLALALLNRAPTHVRCPECGGATETVLLPPVLRRNQFVHMRWCPSCSWEGLGRNGPEWVRGRRIAHRSGFHWGRARWQSDFGFRFRPYEPVSQLPPHHPSGFRFAENPDAPAAPPAHPSGFRFGGDSEQAVKTEATFRWARPVSPGDFQFRKDRGKGKGKGPGGFNWKGVA